MRDTAVHSVKIPPFTAKRLGHLIVEVRGILDVLLAAIEAAGGDIGPEVQWDVNLQIVMVRHSLPKTVDATPPEGEG